MATTDELGELDAEIVKLRVRGVSEREICIRLGCTPGRVDAALAASARRTLAPGNVLRMLVESWDTLGALERMLAAEGGDKALVRQCRRQRERAAKLILERLPGRR